MRSARSAAHLAAGGLLLSGTAAARGRQVLGGSGVRLLHGLGAYLWAIAGIAVAAVGLASRPAAADTLEWALVQAYQNNPSLNAQRAALRATDENVPQALSGYRPKLSITANGGTQYQKAASEIPVAGTIVNSQFAQTFFPRIVLLYSKGEAANQ